MSLLWRVFAVNVVVVAAGAVALVATPATVSHPVAEAEAIVVAVGIATILAMNLLLLRRVLGPLGRLTRFVRGVRPLEPGGRAEVGRADSDVRTLATAVNEMLDRLEGERRESARRALAAQEAERRRVARELHDEVGQALTAAMLTLGRAGRDLPAQAAEDLADARERVRESLHDVRAIATRLRPDVLEDLGLVSALRALTVDLERGSDLSVQRTFSWEPEASSPEVELVIYRVAQEALTNVARHADATRVWIDLDRQAGEALLRIRDDGRGASHGLDGTGIRGMRERALLVGGQLQVTSGDGVELILRVPLR